MISILIVEDDPTIRETLEFNLKLEGFEVLTAADGLEGLEVALKNEPKIILLDLLLPELDGLTLCQNLRKSNSKSHIIMITALSADSDKVRGLTLGADDYITKPFNFEELLARIRAWLRHSSDSMVDSRSFAFGDVILDPIKHELTVKGKAVKVRPKEWLLLIALAKNPGILFSRQKLSSIVWGADFLGSSRTIDVHILRLREKVEALSGYTFIETVHGLGYRFELTQKVENCE